MHFQFWSRRAAGSEAASAAAAGCEGGRHADDALALWLLRDAGRAGGVAAIASNSATGGRAGAVWAGEAKGWAWEADDVVEWLWGRGEAGGEWGALGSALGSACAL